MGLIEEYLNEKYPSAKEKHEAAEKLRVQFVSDYPVEKISSLSMEEYLIAKEGYGNVNSFCRRLLYDLRPLSSMGNVRYDVFGIYIKDGVNICLSKTFKNMFGEDVDTAFTCIKNEIRDLLINVGLGKYETVKDCRLNRAFIYKLISIYYPKVFVPVGTAGTLNQYCDRLGIEYDDSEELIFRNLKLVDWKSHQPETDNWENWMIMSFCDWLWRSDRWFSKETSTVNSPDYNTSENDINIPRPPIKILQEGNIIHVICINCGKNFIKAKRCPECGQLQKYED